jgi:hypothetical protein
VEIDQPEDIMANEPGAAVLAIFSQLIDRVKNTQPVGSDDKPTGRKVFSQLIMGMPIDRRDYLNPWSPSGGASLREAPKPVPVGQPLSSNPQMEAAMRAAWNTSVLCNTMLQVTKNDTYKEYPTGRHLDFAYDAILNGMTGKELPEEPEELKKRRLEAQKVLYKLDADGNLDIGTETSVNIAYQKNTTALGDAKEAFANGQAQANIDPVKAQAWPVASAKLSKAVKLARDKLVAQGAGQVEKAISVINSIGIPVETHMINKAKERWDNWNLGLSGVVPADMPYSVILPTNWCDPDNHDGFQTLNIEQSSYQHFDSSHFDAGSASSWASSSQSSSGGGMVMLGFAAFGGSGGQSSSDSSWQSSSNSTFMSGFKNSATNLSIAFEWGLCKIERPWLMSDLFNAKNWYLANQKKNSISDGTIDGQADTQDKLLPMLPTNMLVVRNVRISSSSWGEDSSMLSSYYGTSQGSDHSEASRVSGSAGVSLGFISFGGTAAHESASASGQSSSFGAADGQRNYGTTFDGTTLTMPGAQVVAFLCDIVPACPESDDPNLPH